MISRVADHCFWLGRYLERAESLARTLLVTRNLALDAELTARQCWNPLLVVVGEEPRYIARWGEAKFEDAEAVQNYLTWESQNPASLVSSIGAARENARSIREVVSLETWEAVNGLFLWLGGTVSRAEYDNHRYNFYRHIREQAQLCLGVIRNTMLHDNAFDFISLGVVLERAGQTARQLDVHHHALRVLDKNPVVEAALWLSILRACSGFEPFMKRHQGVVTPQAVAKFLVHESKFPRSVRFCLNVACERLNAIRPPDEPTLPGGVVSERLKTLHGWVTQNGLNAVDRGELHALLVHVVDEISGLCDEIGNAFLGSTPSSPSMSSAQ